MVGKGMRTLSCLESVNPETKDYSQQPVLQLEGIQAI